MMKMNRWFLLLLTGTMLFSQACQNNNDRISNSLDRLNWSEKNFVVLNKLIDDYGIEGKYYDKNKAPYVVFDWDQTCAHFDVEEALMRYQMFHLRYKITKDQFRSLLKENINGVTQLTEDFQNIVLADINQDLANDYDFLYDHFSGMNGTMSLDEIQATAQFNDFVAKLPFLYDAYCSIPEIGDEYAYPWVIYLFAGQTTEEVKAMAREAISYELSNRLGKQSVQSPADFVSKAGVVSYTYRTGLRVFPEMQNLISTFKGHGIDVFIVSASYKPVVEAFSGIGTYGYNVPSENLVAMELATTDDGIILPEYKAGWFKTIGKGKVEAINRVITTDLGKNWDPIFSAGDSNGDYEMLTEFPDMKLSLIWNRVKGGKIGELCKLAIDEMNSATPRYILQGRNENTGMVLPCSESILLGKIEKQLLFKD